MLYQGICLSLDLLTFYFYRFLFFDISLLTLRQNSINFADAVLEIAKKAFHDRIYGLIAAQIETFERTDKEYERLIEIARQQIDSSEDAAENRQYIKLWNSLNKERRIHTNTLLTRLHHILASRTTPDE